MKDTRRDALKKLLVAGGAGAALGTTGFKHIVPIEDPWTWVAVASWYPEGVPPFVQRPPHEHPIGAKCNTDLAISWCTSKAQKSKIKNCSSEVQISLCTTKKQKNEIDDCTTDANISQCTSKKQKGEIDDCTTSANKSQCTSTKQHKEKDDCTTDWLATLCTSKVARGRVNDP